MERAKNHPVIRKAILACSYNDSGPELEQRIKEGYELEKKAGKTSLNHLILRNSRAPIDTLKFNIPLGGIPIFLYTLNTMRRAGIEKVVVVGNDDTRRIYQAFCDHFKIKGFEFVHEGKPEEWSLSNTILKGKQALLPEEDELVLVCPGDTPFITLEELVRSKFTAYYDMIAPFNNKTYSGDFYPRNFHYVLVDERGVKYPAKESSALLVNLAKLDKNRFGDELYDKSFGARKSYEKGNPQQKFIAELLFKEKGKLSLKRTVKTLSIIGASQFMREAYRYASRRIRKEAENEKNVPHIRIKSCEEIIEHALGIPDFNVKIYPAKDPAAMLDIDSFEDLVFAEAMINYFSNPNMIYPYYDELKSFCEKNERGSFGCEFLSKWYTYGYINTQFLKFGINARYERDGRFYQELFPLQRIEGEIGLIQNFLKEIRQ